MGTGEVTRYIGKYGTKRVRKAVLIGTLGSVSGDEAADNPEGVDRSVFDGIKAAIKADRPAFLMEFSTQLLQLRRHRRQARERTSPRGKLERGCRRVCAGTLACVDAWIEDFRKDIPHNDVPTLILHGDADRILPADATSRRQAKMIKNARLVELRMVPTACCGLTPNRSIPNW